MNTWLLWVLTLNAQTGDLLDSHADPDSKPVTPEACAQAMIEKGPQLVIDGKVKVFICYNMAKDGSKVTT
jgi:hypothetical protein